MIRLQGFLLAAASLVRLCVAQASGWDLQDGQVNTTMCYWTTPRAAVVRDTVYLDGGYLWWQPGMADGSYGQLIGDGNPLGLVYQLNFSSAFNTSSNITSIFSTTSKAPGGGNANNIGPNYVDGGMIANDYGWFTYGGLLQPTDAFPTQDGDKVATYQKYPDGDKQFLSGYIVQTLPDGVTRYVTDGAAVSVPSENLGYYFGGLRSSAWGNILQSPGRNNTLNADTLSTTLISVDMTTQGKEVWKNNTLPTTVPGRASAEIVWVPVGERGILVAIGGVIHPSYANINRTNNATWNAESEEQSPEFLSTVSVYDIKTETWYEQETTDGPATLAQGCAVVASAQDGSSHSIYWYGGFDGIHPTGDFNDDVYILSVPAFMWMKVKSGTPSHGRAGHKCVKPYPDQMLVIGGYASLSGTQPKCVDGGIVQIFNLSSTEWISSYDPSVWTNYTVPSHIYDMIGGGPSGSATQLAPMATGGFSDSKLQSVFNTKYDATKITTWYPYAPSPTQNTTRTDLPTPISKSSSGTPKYLAPVLAVVLGLFFITLIILGILLWRRRKYLRSNPTATQSENGTMDNRHWVANWLRSTPADAKAPTVTTDDTPMTPYEDVQFDMPEVAGTQVHEMMDTSRPVELHDTGFHPLPLSYSQRRNNSALTSSPSVTSQTSHASTVSRDSHSPRPGISPMHTPRADSPLGNTQFLSGVSGVSETDRGHLRGISETSVSSDGRGGGGGGGGSEYATPMEMREVGQEGRGLALSDLPTGGIGGSEEGRPAVVSPLTPPTGQGEGSDYLGSRERPSLTTRRSNFAEGLDEVQK